MYSTLSQATLAPAKLSSREIIEEGKPMDFKCSADAVGLSPEITFIIDLVLSRKLFGSHTPNDIGRFYPYNIHSKIGYVERVSLNYSFLVIIKRKYKYFIIQLFKYTLRFLTMEYSNAPTKRI